MLLKQLIPQEFCLKCEVCCRFTDEHTCWTPKDSTQHIKLIKHKDYFICPYFNPQNHFCKIYPNRPFECQLYPFLLVKKNKEFFLALDKNCPYLENCNKRKLNGCINYLKKEFQKKQNKLFLEQNKELFSEYPLDSLEILFPYAI